MALVTSLFHDAGYIREFDDRKHRNGAEFTLYHVTRSARFLARFLPSIGMDSLGADLDAHRAFHRLRNETQPDSARRTRATASCGHLLGTADLIAQMADRCYLEKCRDRLYPEFVLGGIAAAPGSDGAMQVRYSSGLDLLRQTPQFVRETRMQRLEGEFGHAYRLHGSRCSAARIRTSRPSTAISGILHRVLRTERWPHAAPQSAAVHFRGRPARSGARLDVESPEDALGLSTAGRRVLRARSIADHDSA